MYLCKCVENKYLVKNRKSCNVADLIECCLIGWFDWLGNWFG